jgi:hypothetical protein
MAAVSEACEGRGVWVVDRGGDRGALYADLLAKGRSFIIRQKGDRHLRWGWRTIETARLAADCPLCHATRIVHEENGQEVSCRLDYGSRPVRLPEHPDEPLWLVVPAWPRRRTARTPPTHSPKPSLPRLRGRNGACRSAATTCWRWA